MRSNADEATRDYRGPFINCVTRDRVEGGVNPTQTASRLPKFVKMERDTGLNTLKSEKSLA